MQPEGMVHALEQIHRLLVPSGILIDISSTPATPLYEVRRDGAITYSEPEPGFCGDRYLKAQKAMENVIGRGLFAREDSRCIQFEIVADTAPELLAFQYDFYAFAVTPETAEEDRPFAARLEEARRIAGTGARVAAHEVGLVSRLRRTVAAADHALG